MINLLYAVIGIVVLFGITEILWRHQKISHELIRKFLHISLGVFIAFWPFFLSWNQIYILVILFLVGILMARTLSFISKKITLFSSVKKLDRQSLGEIYFSLGIGFTALLTHDKYIFMASVLTLSLADGLAAIIGKRYGTTTKYRVFGAHKSLVGSAVFLVTTMIIIVIYYALSARAPSLMMILLLPPIATFVESFCDGGIDNLVIPLTILIALKNF